MYVSTILKEKGDRVVSVRPDEKVLEAARILNAERVGAALVTEKQADGQEKLLGIISERDVLNSIARHGELALHRDVKEVMTSKVVTCSPREKLETLMHEMTIRRIRHLPVMEGDAIVGIVSIGDVVKNRLGELETETNMLQHYIAS